MDTKVTKLIRPVGIREPSSPRDKVRTVAEVAEIAEQSRHAGRVVVQAHGTFDLLHLGHVRHLEAARKLGDTLIVTVTADRFVNKGPGRPVFNAELRAEMLATLEYVDWVAINDEPDAVSAIDRIRPDLYIKGHDYHNPQGDITGKIVLEREAVEAHGGRIQLTDEVTFSSTELINRHLNVFEPHIRQHLDTLREDGRLDQLCELIERVANYKVLIVGDAIIDEYQYVMPMHKTPKEHVIATRYQDSELFAGGVFAAANHVASICKQVDIITCIGDWETHDDLIRQSLKPNVGLKAFARTAAPTTLKRRFVDPSYMRKLFEVYVMNDEPLTPDVQGDFDGAIAAYASDYDVVIAADYGHGLIAPSSVAALTGHSRFLAVNTQSNSANLGYNLITKYPRANYVCVDAPEARLAVGNRNSNLGDVARQLIDRYIDCSKIIITQGKHGCVTFESGGIAHTIPAFAKNVIDTVGAGDAFLAMTAPLVAAGGSMSSVGFIGNVVGALKVEIVGHRRSIDKPALIKAIIGLLK
jgi:rfaE bifunctional protein nucleotidyltransferase chain/domain